MQAVNENSKRRKMETIYLDNNATTAISPEVLNEMLPYLKELYGNPSSIHSFGRNLYYKIEQAREKVALLIGAEPEEIIFTSCGTESDNTAITSAIQLDENKRHIVTTQVEHPAVLNFVKHLERKGYKATYLPVDRTGKLNIDALMNVIDDDTAIVSIMYANNETGVIFPIAEIGVICRERGILFHTDAVQAVGKVPIDVKKLGVDMLSMSGHKLHAPKGIGVLYVKKGCKFFPYLLGGHQEYGQRAGTENLASIVALGKACELALKNIACEQTSVAELRDLLELNLTNKCSDIFINGCDSERLSNTLNVSFSHVDSEALLLRLDKYGICASAGSACSSGSSEPSHVLRALGVPDVAINGSIRFSLSRYTKAEEINTVIEILPGIINDLRAGSFVGAQCIAPGKKRPPKEIVIPA
jgi:cysteine desulfurase